MAHSRFTTFIRTDIYTSETVKELKVHDIRVVTYIRKVKKIHNANLLHADNCEPTETLKLFTCLTAYEI